MKPKDDYVQKGRTMLGEEVCPYIHVFLNECYFQKMDSASVASAISLCLHNYRKCKVYEALSLKKDS